MTPGAAYLSPSLSELLSGPLVVTAMDSDSNLMVRCPACRQTFVVEADDLGTEIDCPGDPCGTRLRLNSFVLQ